MVAIYEFLFSATLRFWHLWPKIPIITSDFVQMLSEYFGNKNENKEEEKNKMTI